MMRLTAPHRKKGGMKNPQKGHQQADGEQQGQQGMNQTFPDCFTHGGTSFPNF